MPNKIKYTLLSTSFLLSILFLFLFGMPYEAVEATALKWLALAYPDTSTISGSVMYRATSSDPLSAIEGADVVLFQTNNNLFEMVSSEKTDSTGQFQFTDLAIGTYYLGYYTMTPDGSYMVQFHNGKDELDTADGITISTDASIINNPPAIFSAPAEPLVNVLADGGGSVVTDATTGKIYVNNPSGNVSFGVENLCGSNTFASLLLEYGNLSSYQMVYITINDHYVGTIPRADMILASADISINYICTRSGEEGVEKTIEETNVLEVVGRITQHGAIGEISSALTGQPFAGAFVKLYHVPDAVPDSGAIQDGACRTSTSVGASGGWSNLPAATPDATQFLLSSDILSSGIADPPVNPVKTDGDGTYAWDLADGCYYVEVTAPNSGTSISPLFGVLSTAPASGINLTLQPAITMYAPFIQATRPQ